MTEQSEQPKTTGDQKPESPGLTAPPVEGFLTYLDRIRKAINAQTSDQPKRRKPMSMTFNR